MSHPVLPQVKKDERLTTKARDIVLAKVRE
jgi:hypothetical protein